MNIVAIVGRAYPLFGGAQITVWSLLKRLRDEYQYTCALFTPHAYKRTHTRAGITLSTYRDPDELKMMIKARRPQVLLGAIEFATEAVGIASRFDLPTLAYFQSYEYCQPTLAEKRLWGVDLARQYPSRDEVEYTLSTSDVLLVNSKHMQNCFGRKYGLTPRVLYPEFALGTFRAARHPQYITGICGSAYKGIEIFLTLADAFPDERFLLVGDVQPDWFARVRERPNILLRGRDEPPRFLRDSKIVLVPSQWAEPFGRIAVEALGFGIPILASYTGGLKEILGSSPMGVKQFRSPEAWRVRLAALLASEKLLSGYSQLGRALVSKFLQGDSTRQLAQIVQELAARRVPSYDASPLVCLRGADSQKTAFSMDNAAWRKALSKEIQLDDGQAARRFQPPDIVIDHDFSVNFGQLVPPPSGKWVVARPWDFGRYPEAWVAKINAECDQLWVHTHYVLQQAIASGIDPRRVRIVPLGIDPRIFKPKGTVYPLPRRKSFKFIFLGATVFRKGIDILLRAYSQAFTAKDNVCLVIKDHPHNVFYTGISYHDEIVNLKRDPRVAPIVYINRYLSQPKLASLYRACDVGVFPYRAEGFCIPILEAMACGLPPIVPRFGACLDFCTAENAFLMPARRVSLPIQGRFAYNTLGFQEELSHVEFAEVPVSTLADLMRQAYSMSCDGLEAKARVGIELAQGHFTWRDSAAHILNHIASLDRYDTPYRLRITRRISAERFRKQESAQRLFEDYLSAKAQ